MALRSVTYLTFFSMYSTSDGRWEFCTSNSVRSASSRQGGGSLCCRVGGSLRMRRILIQTHTHKKKSSSYWKDALRYSDWQNESESQTWNKPQIIILSSFYTSYFFNTLKQVSSFSLKTHHEKGACNKPFHRIKYLTLSVCFIVEIFPSVCLFNLAFMENLSDCSG